MKANIMKISLLIVCAVVFLSCTEDSISPEPTVQERQQFGPQECRSDDGDIDVEIDDLKTIDRKNASDYRISGTCELNSQSEITVYIEGYPLDEEPLCNRGKWETQVDLTGIVNKKERVQIAVSQSNRGGVFCQTADNYFKCPDGYIGVPELRGFTSDSFCVMKYEAKVEDKKDLPCKGYQYKRARADSLASGVLITRCSYESAVKACKENGVGYDLITNKEWQTVARYIEQNEVNWSKKTTKVENKNRLNIGNTSGVQHKADDDDILDEEWTQNKRTHKLANNEYIWDLAGNLQEWVKSSISSLPATHTDYIYNLPDSLKKIFGPSKRYSSLDASERRYGYAGLGYMRGGSYTGYILRGGRGGRFAGIFSVDTTVANRPTAGPHIGFRCAYHP